MPSNTDRSIRWLVPRLLLSVLLFYWLCKFWEWECKLWMKWRLFLCLSGVQAACSATSVVCSAPGNGEYWFWDLTVPVKRRYSTGCKLAKWLRRYPVSSSGVIHSCLLFNKKPVQHKNGYEMGGSETCAWAWIIRPSLLTFWLGLSARVCNLISRPSLAPPIDYFWLGPDHFPAKNSGSVPSVLLFVGRAWPLCRTAHALVWWPFVDIPYCW